MFLHRLPKFAHMLPANHPMCIKCQNRGQLKPTTMIYQLENAPLQQTTTQGTPKTSCGAVSWHIVSCVLQTGNCNKKHFLCVWSVFTKTLWQFGQRAGCLEQRKANFELTNFALLNKIFAFSSWWKFPFLQNGVKIKPELKKNYTTSERTKNAHFKTGF